jgi:hypothetical protein
MIRCSWRRTQLGPQLEALDHPLVHRRLEDAVTPLAVALRHVHRDVGVSQQLGRVGYVGLAVDEADTDAGAREDLFGLDLRRDLERLQNPGGGVGGLGRVRCSLEQDGELVPAETRDSVGRPDGDQKPLRDLLQNPVARLVAEAVVDRLEVVQVDEQHRNVGKAALCAHQSVLHAVREEGAVGEARDRVVKCLVRQLLLESLALAHVAAVQDDPLHVLVVTQVGVLNLELQARSIPVLDRALEGMALRAGRAVLRDQMQQPGPVGLAQDPVEARSLDVGDGVPEDALDRGALVGDHAVGVEHRDQVARVRDKRSEARFALPPVQVGGE